jgi:putative transposase
VVPQLPHHVTQRGNRRREVFFSPQDRQVYLGLLRQYAGHYSLQILGYCLMSNHVHLVAVPAFEDSLAKTLREVHGRYARYRNAIEHSSGHLWQCRYYSCAFEATRMPEVMRYVELNPVRAGLVRAAEDYAWSSAVTHLGGIDPGGVVVQGEGWLPGWNRLEWAEWLHAAGPSAGEIRSLREATYAGRPLGSTAFLNELERQLARRLRPGKAGRPRKEEGHAAAG